MNFSLCFATIDVPKNEKLKMNFTLKNIISCTIHPLEYIIYLFNVDYLIS